MQSSDALLSHWLAESAPPPRVIHPAQSGHTSFEGDAGPSRESSVPAWKRLMAQVIA